MFQILVHVDCIVTGLGRFAGHLEILKTYRKAVGLVSKRRNMQFERVVEQKFAASWLRRLLKRSARAQCKGGCTAA